MSIQSIQGSVLPPTATRQETPGAQAPLTPDEKQFFEELYPEAAGEIRSYPTYSRSGETQEARLGSMIDRKG
jgi:hypothetical protein